MLIADDHEVVTRGVSSLLSSREDITVINDALNGREAVDKARHEHPDLIILDISMPVLDGFGAAKQIRSFLPKTPILFLSMYSGPIVVANAKAAGGQGFVRKDEAGHVLLHAVDTLLQKETFFPHDSE